jgi:hypothetical protein
VSEPVSRFEYLELLKRVDAMDMAGTRGVAVLGVQLQEVAKDVAKLEGQMESHRREHVSDEASRVSARRWIIATIIAAVAAVDGPVLTIVLAARH